MEKVYHSDGRRFDPDSPRNVYAEMAAHRSIGGQPGILWSDLSRYGGQPCREIECAVCGDMFERMPGSPRTTCSRSCGESDLMVGHHKHNVRRKRLYMPAIPTVKAKGWGKGTRLNSRKWSQPRMIKEVNCAAVYMSDLAGRQRWWVGNLPKDVVEL